HGFPVTPFRHVRVRDDLLSAKRDLGVPAILKTADFGYDGKGQVQIDDQTAWPGEAGDFVYESFVDFQRELSVVAARGVDGSFAHWGVIENTHRDRILDLSVSPANVPTRIETEAIEISRGVLE